MSDERDTRDDRGADYQKSDGSVEVQLERMRGQMKANILSIGDHEKEIKNLIAVTDDYKETKATLQGGVKVVFWAGGLLGLILALVAALFSGKFSH